MLLKESHGHTSGKVEVDMKEGSKICLLHMSDIGADKPPGPHAQSSRKILGRILCVLELADESQKEVRKRDVAKKRFLLL